MTLLAPSAPRQMATRVLAGLVLAVIVITGAGMPLPAAQAESFNPGNIISDDVFYNSSTMSAAQIDGFLRERGSSCVTGTDGSPCLKDFLESTWTRTSTVCPGVYNGAANESAATIIYKVSQACQINPQVLLVTLQKEQSLLTVSGRELNARRYRVAMGFGCPDTAPCDAQYYGFFNQVYSAAQQFQRYRQSPARYGYRAGMTNTVGFHPNSTCGSSQVYITSQATAGLYNYTPYQPNAAILNGTANSCSSTGNYNFWRFFSTWFGSPQGFSVGGAIGDLWNYLGGSGGLGNPTSKELTGLVGGGSGQHFTNGSIFSSAAGTYWIPTTFEQIWSANGRESGALGYPASHPIASADGAYTQSFQRGFLVQAAGRSTYLVTGSVSNLWAYLGGANGLGAPVGNRYYGLSGGGTAQPFVNGSIWTYGSGTYWVSVPFSRVWEGLGRETGTLGYPTSHPTTQANGAITQSFQGGTIVQRPGDSPLVITGSVSALWAYLGGINGLGAPAGNRFYGLAGGGTAQPFINGAIWTYGSGTYWVSKPFERVWEAHGRETGTLGYPIGHPTVGSGNTVTQAFQGGVIVQSPGGTPYAITGSVAQLWTYLGGVNGLGAPAANRFFGLSNGGSAQPFTNSAVWTFGNGTYWIPKSFERVWESLGREVGVLGYPTSHPVLDGSGTITQTFQGGSITQAPGAAPQVRTR